jgi:hypothetical protein
MAVADTVVVAAVVLTVVEAVVDSTAAVAARMRPRPRVVETPAATIIQARLTISLLAQTVRSPIIQTAAAP